MKKISLGVVAAVLLMATGAEAERPYLPTNGNGYYIFVDPQLYPRERLPHFALYPPVYYSLPVPRTYGHSPFAYPPGYTTPDVEVVCPRPATIVNPYVPQSLEKEKGEKAKPKAVPAKPVRIANPYVKPAEANHTARR